MWGETPGTKQACDDESNEWLGGEGLEAESLYTGYFNNLSVILDCNFTRREKRDDWKRCSEAGKK